MKKFLLNFLVISCLLYFWSCTTELEVNAPYRETKVMYSILDPTLPFQTIRISRGFLGEGGRPATDIAKNNPDSSLYASGTLLVELIEQVDTSIFLPGRPTRLDTLLEKRRWVCYDTVIKNKEAGVFYSPDQLLYKTPNLLMDTTPRRKMVYTFKVTNRRTGQVSQAKTNIPGNNYFLSEPVRDILTDPNSFNFRSTADTRIRLTRPDNVEIAEISLHWRLEVLKMKNGVVDTTYEEWFMNDPGISVVQTSSIQGLVSRGQFWDFIKEELKARGNENVLRRKFLTSRLEVYGANKEYNDYRTVNGNYNAITQSVPVYTNVSNGLGIVCARNKRFFPIKLSNSNIDTLIFRYPELKLVK